VKRLHEVNGRRFAAEAVPFDVEFVIERVVERSLWKERRTVPRFEVEQIPFDVVVDLLVDDSLLWALRFP
jgi:hypothetical protein